MRLRPPPNVIPISATLWKRPGVLREKCAASSRWTKGGRGRRASKRLAAARRSVPKVTKSKAFCLIARGEPLKGGGRSITGCEYLKTWSLSYPITTGFLSNHQAGWWQVGKRERAFLIAPKGTSRLVILTQRPG